jgi:hypothetical protein
MPFHYPAILIDEYGDRYSFSSEGFCQSIVLPDREGYFVVLHEFLYIVDFALDEDGYDPDPFGLIGQRSLLKFGDFLFALLSPCPGDINHIWSAEQRVAGNSFSIDGLEREVLDRVFGEDSQRKDKNKEQRC